MRPLVLLSALASIAVVADPATGQGARDTSPDSAGHSPRAARHAIASTSRASLRPPAATDADRPRDIVLRLGALAESQATVDGRIAFYHGALGPVSPYLESVGAGAGGFASLGTSFSRRFELALEMTTSRRSGRREGSRLRQQVGEVASWLRMDVVNPERTVVPFVGAGLAVRQIDESPAGAGAPWPGTRLMRARQLLVGGGARVAIGSSLALEARAGVGRGRTDRLELPGRVAKTTHAEAAAAWRLGLAVRWQPWLPEDTSGASGGADADTPLAPDHAVRVHVAEATAAGFVIRAAGDTLTVQARRHGAPFQIGIPYGCLTGVDRLVGVQPRWSVLLASATRGTVLGSALVLLLDELRLARPPSAPGKFATAVALPSAALGAVHGIFRSRERWTPIPLPPRARAADRSAGLACDPARFRADDRLH